MAATNVAQDRLGDLFVREGLITETQLTQALAEGRRKGPGSATRW